CFQPDFRFWTRHNLPRLVPFQKRASLANSALPVMGDAPEDGGCKERYRGQIFIARSFGASVRDSRSAWLRIATCLKSEARALPPGSLEILIPKTLSAKSPYCPFTPLSDPASFTATFEKKIFAGFPSAVPRWSVETSRGPAFL